MREVSNVRTDLTGQIAEAREGVLDTVNNQFSALRFEVKDELGDALGVADRRLGDTLASANAAIAVVKETADAAKPVLENAAVTESSATQLLDTYRVMPSQLAAEFAPSWASLQPEITCRQANGTGYGGCWHSRITALMGEAANVGGVFTQKFPGMADSFTGIAGDTRRFADKYVDPHPQTFKQKIWTGFKLVFGGAEAAARGGLLESQVAIPKQ